jgi:2-methylcitrate dehydratase PrpD
MPVQEVFTVVNIFAGTAIEALAANVLETRFEDFDPVTVKNARNRIIDVMGCAIGGAGAPGNQALVDLVKDWGGKQEATILVHGGKAPAHNAALVNAIMCRSFDFEVMSVLVEGKQYAAHHAATMVMTALALAEAEGKNGQEMITAMITGDDVTARVIAASDIDLGLGWDGTGTYTAFGATAIAGRLLDLNKREMRNAFGIVLNNVASTVQGIWDGATTFKYGQGSAAMNGIIAAKLAKKGWKGPDDALLGRFGFYALYTHGCKNPNLLTRDLGKKYYAEAVYKPYPCCRATHSTIDAALAVITGHDIQTGAIDEVTISIPARLLDSFVAKPFQVREYPHCDAIFSLRYTCATALLHGCVKQQHFTPEAINDPGVNKLIAKIRLAALPETAPRAVTVRVKTRDGREFTGSAATGKGDPLDSPLSDAEIIAKYRSQVEFSQTVRRENAEKLLESLQKLEKAASVAEIVTLAVR